MAKDSRKRCRSTILLTVIILSFAAAPDPLLSDDRSAGIATEDPQAPGTIFRDCPLCPEMVVVPGGRSFIMGEVDDKTGRLGPRHEVRIPRPFAAGRFEVTLTQWETCVAKGGCRAMGGNRWRESIRIYGRRPSSSWMRDREYLPEDTSWIRLPVPVVRVDWRDAKAYVTWLSRMTGKAYRLLSEAEWEYAARAGTKTRWFCGSDSSCLDAVAWYAANSRRKTYPVGSKRANPFGLHDVQGSLWEWVEDCWHPNYHGAPSDGSAWTSRGDCSKRVLRGGSWASTAWTLRIANRFGQSQWRYALNFGIRVARTLGQ